MRVGNRSVVLVVALALVGVTTLFLGALGYSNYRTQERSEYAQLQTQLDYGVEQVAVAIALPLWNFDEEQIDTILASAMKFESISGATLTLGLDKAKPSYIRVRGKNNEVLNVSDLFPTDGLLQSSHNIYSVQRDIGSITLFATPRYIQRQLDTVLWQTLVSIAIVDVLLVVSLYYVLWRMVLRPLQYVEAFAVSVEEGPVSQDISNHRFHGELESLRLAVIRMKDRLATGLADLREQASVIANKEKSARLSELRVQQILAASPLPITVGNLESGKYIRVNPAWERQFMYKEADILGRTSVELGFWKDLEERRGWISRFNTEGRVTGYEVSFLMRDGSTKIFMLSSERFIYGEEECVLTMSVDVTDRKALETQLLHLNANLEQRVAERTADLDRSNKELVRTMETLQRTQDELIQSDKLASLGSLVAGVAHELNTPIGNALVAASSLSEEVSAMQGLVHAGEMRKSSFDRFMSRVAEGSALTLRSLERAIVLISSFKQVAVDQASERRRDFDLAQTLSEVIDTLKPNLKRAGVNLVLELEEGVVMQSYPGPLGQVIINLFTNALTHAFEGRSQGTITVKARRWKSKKIKLTISDDGVGIAPEHIGQIFDPFFTTKLGRGGSGLGLSVSHRIVVKVLGGQIAIQSRLGEGATFTLNLPTSAPDVVA